MKYVEAPGQIDALEHPVVFLSGGIIDCEDWQKKVADGLTGKGSRKGTVLNPRGKGDLVVPGEGHDRLAWMRDQIFWEHAGLWKSDMIAFWFAGGNSVQPRALFEFGCHLGRYCVGAGPKIVVGVDDGYMYRDYVLTQLEAHGRSLNGPWKVSPTFSIKNHIENILRSL